MHLQLACTRRLFSSRHSVVLRSSDAWCCLGANGCNQVEFNLSTQARSALRSLDEAAYCRPKQL